jgi:hypothetical protein
MRLSRVVDEAHKAEPGLLGLTRLELLFAAPLALREAKSRLSLL